MFTKRYSCFFMTVLLSVQSLPILSADFELQDEPVLGQAFPADHEDEIEPSTRKITASGPWGFGLTVDNPELEPAAFIVIAFLAVIAFDCWKNGGFGGGWFGDNQGSGRPSFGQRHDSGFDWRVQQGRQGQGSYGNPMYRDQR